MFSVQCSVIIMTIIRIEGSYYSYYKLRRGEGGKVLLPGSLTILYHLPREGRGWGGISSRTTNCTVQLSSGGERVGRY